MRINQDRNIKENAADLVRFKEIDMNNEEITAQWSKGQKMSFRQAIEYALGYEKDVPY